MQAETALGARRRTGAPENRSRYRAMLWLGIVVAFCTLLATIWLIRVPFFEEPDEIAHVDYVFQLFDVGHPFRVTGRHPHGEVTPQTRYIVRAIDYRRMRYNPYARVIAGYGTAAFFRGLDAGAPAPSGHAPGSRAAIPYLMYSYPPAYYVMEAAVLTATYALSGSLSDGFIAMRAVNVLLLAGTLLVSYFSLRAYGIGERSSLLTVLAIGAFPLTTHVFSYVQPDNATTFLISVIVYAVARGRRSSSYEADVLALCALGALFLVKPPYGFAAWLATVPLLRFKAHGRTLHPMLRLVTVALPLMLFAISNHYLNPVSGLESPLAWIVRTRGLSAASPATPAAMMGLVLDGLAECFKGSVFYGFWLAFGFRGGRIFPDYVVPFFQVATILGVSAFLLADRTILTRVVAARTFGRRSALRLLIANHPLNLYLLTTAMLISAHVLSGGALELEGRYWCAMLLPLAIVTLRTIPRLAPKRRRIVASALATGMATYSVFASAVAVRAMNADFYGVRAPQREAVADITKLQSAGVASGDPYSLHLGTPQAISISGFAIDMLTGFAAKNVYVEVDGRTRKAADMVGLPFPEVAQIFNDDRVADTGFRIDVPAAVLPRGKHRLRFFVGRVTRADGIPFWAEVSVIVARNPRPLHLVTMQPAHPNIDAEITEHDRDEAEYRHPSRAVPAP
jgi:hypothetical protein